MQQNLRFISLLVTAKQNCSRYIRHYVESGLKLNVMTKDSNQVFTNVDLVAQAIFEKSIKRVFPEIEVIGEENLRDPAARAYLAKEKLLISHYSKHESFTKKFQDNLETLFNEKKQIIINENEEQRNPSENVEQLVKRKQVKILLDPLDATYSFVNKNYNEATILAGVLVNNRPFIGTITSPFYGGEEPHGGSMMTYFNIPNQGIFSINSKKSKWFQNVENFNVNQVRVSKKKNPQLQIPGELKLIVSRTREEKLKQILKPLLSSNIIRNLQIKTDNGMGYRSIKMIEEGYYFMTVKSCLGFWDLCATDAIFRELGGGCLSLQGEEIDYSKAGSKEVFPYDIMIGDDQSSLKYYLQHYKLLCQA